MDRLPKSDKTQVISIAALRSGAGASTFAANIAVALLARRPVLLIDLHHTAPGLHACFSIEPTAHDLTSAAPWTDSILKTPLDRLSLLPLFTPHTEKEMSDLKLKKRIAAFLKENPVHRLVLVDLAPIGRSELFEEVAEYSDVFVLLCGPEPTGISAASALKRLTKTMKKRPILRVTRTRDTLPAAATPRPGTDYEFLIE